MAYQGIGRLGVAPVLNRQPATNASTTVTGEDTELEEDDASKNKKLLIGGIIVAVLAVGAVVVYKGTKKRGYRRNPPRKRHKRAKRSYRGHKYYLKVEGRRYGPFTDGVAKRMKREHGGTLVRSS
jgi:hypothetical protein